MKQKIEQFQERMHITSGRKLTENILKVGQRIKQARMEHKLSQAELGEKIGCSNNHMSHVEIGQTKPSLPMMLKLSLVLNKSLDYFFLDTPFTQNEIIINHHQH